MHYSRRIDFRFVLVLVLGCRLIGTAVAAAPADAKSLASAAFAKSKTAQSIDDFSQVIELCERAINVRPDEATAKYARDLAAWGCTRRGELRAEAAQRLAAANKADEARSLDHAALADFSKAIEYDA